MTFDVYSFRFHFAARDAISFPPGGPANTLRGAFGSALRKIACAPNCPGFAGRPIRECQLRDSCVYAHVFEPTPAHTGPSGLADLPRPFVFRASHLAGCTFAPGQPFWFDVNFFEVREPMPSVFAHAFAELTRAELVLVEQVGVDGSPAEGPPISIPLDSRLNGIERLQVEFRTPTELKDCQRLAATPDFGVLFARARDRVATLRALYGPGPLDIDFRAMGERAQDVVMSRCALRQVDLKRRSGRTGQVHGIGGFVGIAEYEGAVGEFLPYLEAARFTGVGRHCVWGKGEILPRIILSAQRYAR